MYGGTAGCYGRGGRPRLRLGELQGDPVGPQIAGSGGDYGTGGGQEQAVVRSQEDLASALHHKAGPVGAHLRIDNSDVDGAGGKVADGGEQGKRPGAHVLRWDVVGDVNEGDISGKLTQSGEDHALHLGGVEGAEVGEEGDG